ncbi:vitamin K epoxide reductase family protein [Arthrobacter sp. CAN_A1]|uniref:vitamin K epoxide reductase family protein n=1 Tax=Arthrobacter sp. CAN_A1 TaxID=2787717 RepID=UPI0018CAB3AA
MDSPAPRFARDRPFGLLLVITGLVGWLASGQLVLERLAVYADPDYVTSCDVNAFVSCGEVFKTWQASLLGFPNPLLGIVAFSVIITTGAMLLGGAQVARWYWLSLQVGVSLGMVFTVWLWSQALFAIGILCTYCIVVWAAMIVLTIFLTSRNMLRGALPAGPRARALLGSWTGTTAALLLVAAAASVFFRFIGVFVG